MAHEIFMSVENGLLRVASVQKKLYDNATIKVEWHPDVNNDATTATATLTIQEHCSGNGVCAITARYTETDLTHFQLTVILVNFTQLSSELSSEFQKKTVQNRRKSAIRSSSFADPCHRSAS